jgi:hypothetical protein
MLDGRDDLREKVNSLFIALQWSSFGASLLFPLELVQISSVSPWTE